MQDFEVPPAALYRNPVVSPLDFEKLVANYFKVSTDSLHTSVEHNVQMKASDGDYQIDILLTQKLAGLDIKILVECKQYKSSIKREKVEILEAKLRSLGCHKGALFSTSPFQSGALLYAKAHGIACVMVSDQRFIFETRAISARELSSAPATNYALHEIEATDDRFQMKLI